MLAPENVTVSISMPREKAKELGKLAKKRGYTKSGLVRAWVYAMMDEDEES